VGTHVFARLSGHGLTLIPLSPYRFERAGSGAAAAVRLTHEVPGAMRAVTVTPRPMPRPGPPQVACAPGTPSLDEVGGLQEGPWLDHWRIETALFTLAWPDGLALQSARDDSRPPAFELHGEQGAFMFFQGPLSEPALPPLQRMAGLGQRVAGTGEGPGYRWVELHYRHEGRDWVQRHALIALRPGQTLVLTAQAPAEVAARTMALMEEVARSVQPGGPVPAGGCH
jgi:hypothetical protein